MSSQISEGRGLPHFVQRDAQVSVVVFADSRPGHPRERYLLEAVNSIALQSVGTEKIELIVTKNFRNEHLDRLLSEAGAKVVFSDDPVLGRRRVQALGHASAGIVVFLSDDDLLEPAYLERTLEVMSRWPSVGYYKCRLIKVNEEGSPLPRSSLSLSASRFDKGPIFLQRTNPRFEQLCLQAALRGLDHCESGCAMKLKAIDMKLLDRVSGGLDHALWASAVFSNVDLFFDDRFLVKYRIHPHSHSLDASRDSDRVLAVKSIREVANARNLQTVVAMENLHQSARLLIGTAIAGPPVKDRMPFFTNYIRSYVAAVRIGVARDIGSLLAFMAVLTASASTLVSTRLSSLLFGQLGSRAAAAQSKANL